MKALHLIHSLYSGQTSYAAALVREQRRQGHHADLAVTMLPSLQALNTYKDLLAELDAEILRPEEIDFFIRQAREIGYDIIHSHSPPTYSLSLQLSTEIGIPYIITCHGPGLNREKYCVQLKSAAALICTSPRTAEGLQGLNPDVRFIPHGVDLEEFKPGEKGEPVKIALVAHIDQWKTRGFHHFCKAIDILAGVDFYVAANKKPESNYGNYLGWISETSTLLSNTDIVAGTNRAVIEGMAAGNAAIVLGQTYQGIVTPEKLKAQDKWDFSGLYGSNPCYKNIFFDLAKLTQNMLYLQKLQQFGRQVAKNNFDSTRMTALVLKLYKDVISNK